MANHRGEGSPGKGESGHGPPPPWFASLRLPSLLRRYPTRVVWSGYLLVNGFLTIGMLTLVAMVSGTPFVFPSVGPTALLLFLHPERAVSSPRNAVLGHAIGIACGYASLWLFGLTTRPSAIAEGVTDERIYCAALSLGLTGALTTLLDLSHPPSGATTLIIALGIITTPYHLAIIELAVVALVVQAIVINRVAGLDYPIWAPLPGTPRP